MTVADLCDEFDLQYVAGMQEAETGIGRLVGPVQDDRSAVAWRAVERYVRGVHQRRYVDADRHRRRSVVFDRGIAGHERRQRIADIGIMDAERTLDRPGKPGIRRNVSGGNVVDLERVRAASEHDLVEERQVG